LKHSHVLPRRGFTGENDIELLEECVLVGRQSTIDGLLGAGLLTPPEVGPKVSLCFRCQLKIDGPLAAPLVRTMGTFLLSDAD